MSLGFAFLWCYTGWYKWAGTPNALCPVLQSGASKTSGTYRTGSHAGYWCNSSDLCREASHQGLSGMDQIQIFFFFLSKGINVHKANNSACEVHLPSTMGDGVILSCRANTTATSPEKNVIISKLPRKPVLVLNQWPRTLSHPVWKVGAVFAPRAMSKTNLRAPMVSAKNKFAFIWKAGPMQTLSNKLADHANPSIFGVWFRQRAKKRQKKRRKNLLW